MASCPRCGRSHSGPICGIPSIGVRIGIGGAGLGKGSPASADSYPIHTVPKAKRRLRLTKHGLAEMLDWGLEQEQKCQEMLKTLPSSLPEYDKVLERLDRVKEVIASIRKQLAERKV